MGLPTTSRPAPAWLRELADARARYQELLGWPVSVQVGPRNLVLAVGEVLDAVTMPAGLGARVRAELETAIICAPVIVNSDGSQWTFLTKPAGPVRASVGADSSPARAQLVATGGFVVIPTAMTVSPADRGQPRWIEPPQPNRPLPPAYAVIGLARRLTDDTLLDRTA